MTKNSADAENQKPRPPAPHPDVVAWKLKDGSVVAGRADKKPDGAKKATDREAAIAGITVSRKP